MTSMPSNQETNSVHSTLQHPILIVGSLTLPVACSTLHDWQLSAPGRRSNNLEQSATRSDRIKVSPISKKQSLRPVCFPPLFHKILYSDWSARHLFHLEFWCNAMRLTRVTADLVITLTAVKILAQLSLRLVLLLRQSTEWCFAGPQLHWVLLHTTYQTFEHSELQQLPIQWQIHTFPASNSWPDHW